MYFMVFGAQRTHPKDPLAWSGPIAVFESDTAEQACQAAAKKVGWMGSYFAVEGYPWGVELIESDAHEFGAERELTHAEQVALRTRELERSVGIGTDEPAG